MENIKLQHTEAFKLQGPVPLHRGVVMGSRTKLHPFEGIMALNTKNSSLQ
jgi:hypothetical protein